MTLLLALLFGAITLGLMTDRLDTRTYGIVAAGGAAFIALMFVFQRFWQ